MRGGALPFEPFVEAFRDLPDEVVDAATSEPEPGATSAFGRLLLGLRPGQEGAAGQSDHSQSKLFELTLGLVRRLSTDAPLVLIVEDIHWADRSTLDLLAFLVRNLRHEAVVLIATCRTDELPRRHPILPVLAELERSPRTRRLELCALDRSEQAEQLEAIVGADIEPGQIDRIWRRSEGNPFYAEELLASGVGAELPDTLREVLLARIGALSENAQSLLRVASVAGRRVVPELLQAAGGLGEGVIEAGLRDAIDHRILVADADSVAERYGFRHALMGEAIYAELLPGERRRLHGSLAAHLETLPEAGTDVGLTAEIANHWFAARDHEKALATAVTAGRAAERAYAVSEALAQYERAIELWQAVPDAVVVAGVDRVELLAWAGRTAVVPAPSHAILHMRAAIALVDETADPIRAGLLYERLGDYAWEALDGETAVAAAKEALRLVPPEPPSVARARVLAGYGKSLMMIGQPRESIPVCREAVAMSRVVGARDVEGNVLGTLGYVLCEFDAEEGIAMCREACEIGLSLGNAEIVARASLLLTSALCDVHPELAIEAGLQAFELARQRGYGSSHGVTDLCIVIDAMYIKGRWDEAETVADRAEPLAATGLGELDLALTKAQLDLGRGRFEEASTRLVSARRSARLADPERQVELYWLMTQHALWQHEPARARAAAAQTFRLPVAGIGARYVGAVYSAGLRAEADLAAVARAHQRRSDVDEAERRGNEISTLMRAYAAEAAAGRPVQVQWTTAYLALCEAELSRLGGSTASEPWSRAAALWGERGNPYERAYALYREAEARLAGGEGRAAAALPAREANEIATGLGAEPLRREIAGLARRSRIELREPGGEVDAAEAADTLDAAAPGAAAPFDLSPRELEVLALLLEGRTNREIGSELYITEKTASVHVSHIMNKLGVTSRGAAAAVAARLGLTHDTAPRS
jgi:DNA-binding CsgD family transcriptional regulator/tetratricopeptide (TPR) repeat protein